MSASDDIFFFQAEDGIRYYKVTGVQTCALPICLGFKRQTPIGPHIADVVSFPLRLVIDLVPAGESEAAAVRSPDSRARQATRACRRATDRKSRRVGKECRSRWSPYH